MTSDSTLQLTFYGTTTTSFSIITKKNISNDQKRLFKILPLGDERWAKWVKGEKVHISQRYKVNKSWRCTTYGTD